MPQPESHPYFVAVPSRELTTPEFSVLARLLTAATDHAKQVSQLRVVGRCGCGACPTVFFRAPIKTQAESDVAHFVGRDKSGGLTGAVVLSTDEGLSQLEFYSVDGHEPWDIPEADSLEQADA